MGILDKIMFWKKKDEFADLGLGDKENLAFGDDFGSKQMGLDQPGFGQPATSQPSAFGTQAPPSIPAQQPQFQQQYQQPKFESPQQDLNSKNLEIISTKIDTLRASLESINQRLANIENIARGDEEQHKRRYY